MTSLIIKFYLIYTFVMCVPIYKILCRIIEFFIIVCIFDCREIIISTKAAELK